MIGVNWWTTAAVQVRAVRDGHHVSWASGSIVGDDGGFWLLTNRHVFRNRPNLDAGRVREGRLMPNGIVVYSCTRDGLLVEASFDIRDTDGSPMWLRHEREEVDVVAFPLGPLDDERMVTGPIPLPIVHQQRPVEVGDEVFVIGFPGGVSVGPNRLAVWTRGTVASEPDSTIHLGQHERLPALLIDARTRAGLSGAIVIKHQPRGTLYGDSETGELLMAPAPMGDLIGIYSGRLPTLRGTAASSGVDDGGRADEAERAIAEAVSSDLGIVWGVDEIQRIIDDGIEESPDGERGPREWDPPAVPWTSPRS